MREDYDYLDDEDPARSRRRRSIITFAVVLLLLFFAAWYALSYIRADQARGEQAATSSSTTMSNEGSTCDISPGQVDVNVYNATNRAGLAARVAGQLEERGFSVKTIANDPKKAKLDGPGQLRYGSNGRKGADLVRVHVGEFEMIHDVRKRPSVDVVLGPTYERMVPEGELPTC